MADRRIPFLWTNDDICAGKTEPMQRQLDFLEKHGIPGVFFVIPKSPDPLTDDAPLVEMLKGAVKSGHECFQHGYVHSPFESGVPETWMLDFAPDVRKQYDAQRLDIEKTHAFDVLVRMLSDGQKIWHDAFGELSPGYRPGWGAFCGNLYKALDAMGYDWCSSRIPCPTSWVYNQGKFDEPLNFRKDVPASPMRMGDRLWEYPLGGDYAFRVPDETDKIDLMVDLAMREFDYYYENDMPMIICSHHHGLDHNNGSGYAVHEKLIPKLLATGRVEPMGMAELHARTIATN